MPNPDPHGKRGRGKFQATGCYGILRPDGKLWMDETCVCEDADILRAEVLPNINQKMVGKCKVVQLFVRRGPAKGGKGK